MNMSDMVVIFICTIVTMFVGLLIGQSTTDKAWESVCKKSYPVVIEHQIYHCSMDTSK